MASNRYHRVANKEIRSCAEYAGSELSILPTHVKVGCRPPICHPDRSVAQWRDLRFALMEKWNLKAIGPRRIRCARE